MTFILQPHHQVNTNKCKHVTNETFPPFFWQTSFPDVPDGIQEDNGIKYKCQVFKRESPLWTESDQTTKEKFESDQTTKEKKKTNKQEIIPVNKNKSTLLVLRHKPLVEGLAGCNCLWKCKKINQSVVPLGCHQIKTTHKSSYTGRKNRTPQREEETQTLAI